jgi:hypothetical protein
MNRLDTPFLGLGERSAAKEAEEPGTRLVRDFRVKYTSLTYRLGTRGGRPRRIRMSIRVVIPLLLGC